MTASVDERIAQWIDRVIDRHSANLTISELAKAVRALSARYVERRAHLATRSPIDSAGKRAAFAAFYAPLHLLTTLHVVRSLGLDELEVDSIVDLGCGTGVASAAWAMASGAPTSPAVFGVDIDAWTLDEARWNWRELGISGTAKRGDLNHPRALPRPRGKAAAIAAWSLNELLVGRPASTFDLPVQLPLLVIEPLSRAANPHWDDWAAKCVSAGGRADEWKFDIDLPAPLAKLTKAAGFAREGLGARSLWWPVAP